MALANGTKLGPYEILSPLGAGGMGEVYRARDTRLGREVAVKVLPEAFAHDPERLARFEREARLLASLNHPNIATLYGLENADGQHLLAMELVEGEGLDAIIARGAVPVDEATAIALQIAEGLEAAHELGIVHRDLKPANVKVRPDGAVKVLDFGLAKAWDARPDEGSLSRSPTITSNHTQAGVILGSAAYMSPEQARGKPVDKRADIWAFGVVLFEMLTGKRLFEGETVSDVLAGLLRDEIDWPSLPVSTPPAVERLLRRCLERNSKNRLRDVGDARLMIEEVLSGTESVRSNEPEKAGETPPRSRWPTLVGMGLAIALSAGGTWWLAGRFSSPAPAAPEAQLRLTLPLPSEYPLDFVGGSPFAIENTSFDVSADGSRLVYLTQSAGVAKIVACDLDSGSYRQLAGTAGAWRPVLSPRGQWVAFIADGRLKRVAYGGGGVDDLAAAPAPLDLTWGRDGMLYWIGQDGKVAWRMSPVLGSPVSTILNPCNCLFVRNGVRPGQILIGRADSEVVRVESNGQEAPLGLRTGDLRVLADGTLIYTRPGRLMARRSLAPGSKPYAVLDGLRTAVSGEGQFALSSTGSLFYIAGGDAGKARIVRRDPSGQEETLPFAAADYGAFDARSDGGRIVVASSDRSKAIEVLDVASKTTQFVDVADPPVGPTLSPDGSHIDVGQHGARGWSVVEYPIASAAKPKTLLSSPHELYPSSWSHDGRFLALGVIGPKTSWISVWDRKTGALKALTSPLPGQSWGPVFSPDDKYLAFTLVGESGSQVYVVPFPDGNQRWLISGGFGEEPQWRRDKPQLVFRRGQEWYGVAYSEKSGFAFEAPSLLFRGPYLNIAGMEYRVLADGSVLLLAPENSKQSTDHLDVIVNWLSEVHRKLANGGAQ